MWWCNKVNTYQVWTKDQQRVNGQQRAKKFFILTLHAQKKVEKQVKSQTSYKESFPKAREMEWAVFPFVKKKFRKVEANQTPEKVGRKERSKLGSKR